MEKLIFKLILFISPLIVWAGNYSHAEKFDFSDFNFKEIKINGSIYLQPRLSGLENYGETSTPQLPVKCVIVALPYDASGIKVAEVHLSNPIEKTLRVNPIT